MIKTFQARTALALALTASTVVLVPGGASASMFSAVASHHGDGDGYRWNGPGGWNNPGGGGAGGDDTTAKEQEKARKKAEQDLAQRRRDEAKRKRDEAKKKKDQPTKPQQPKGEQAPDPEPTVPSVVPGDDAPVVTGTAPVAGENFNAAPSSGTVRVRLPGKRGAVSLGEAASLPVGSVVDARAGVAKLTSAHDDSGAVQTARFSRGTFKVSQSKSANPVTEIVLRGGHLGRCGRPAKAGLASASKRRARGRGLWAEGHGRFRTRGRNGAATVRGTGWITTDTCAGTRVTVRHGLVAVRDFWLHKTFMVPGGKSYLAKWRRSAGR